MNIWVPKARFLEVPTEVPGGSLGGYFKIVGRLDDGRSRVLCDWQPNLITDAGLERQFTTGNFITNCQVGTGNTPPTYADTTLAAIARNHNSIQVTNLNGAQTSAPYYGWNRWTFRFNPPGSNINIAEVGIGWSTGGGTLFSRALTKDVNGNPAAVTWLSTETLDISYELRKYPFLNDVAYDDVISGVHYTGIWRAANVNTNLWSHIMSVAHSFGYAPGSNSGRLFLYTGGTLGGITGEPSGQSATLIVDGYSSISQGGYVAGSRKITGSTTIGPSSALTINMIKTQNTVEVAQKSITPAIVKPVDWTLVLNIQSGVVGRYS